MEQRGLTAKDLERYIGPSGRVSEVLNKKRPVKPLRAYQSEFYEGAMARGVRSERRLVVAFVNASSSLALAALAG